MAALPRVEIPYSTLYPNLDVDRILEVEFESSPSHASPPSSPPSVEEGTPLIHTASSAQFNVSGYVGGKSTNRRFLPLYHSNGAPPVEVDEGILRADIGYLDSSSKNLVSPLNTPRYIRPDATMDMYRPFAFVDQSILDPTDANKLEQFLTEHTRVEYDIDETDLGMLGWLSTRFRTQLLPEMFEVIMSMLDLAAALICLKMHPLERAAREARGNLNTEDNRRCAVCNWAECTDSNTIVFCDGCDVAVHQDCYGIHSIPEGRWLCRKCESGHGGEIRCYLCPHTSGAFKRAINGQWIHLVCALWTPNVRVPDDTSFLEPVRDLELMDPERWTLTCYVCRRKEGTCIQCAAKDCFVAFHCTCAQTAGFYMTDCDHEFSEILKHQQYLPVYCHRHSMTYAPKGFPQPSLETVRRALAEEQERIEQQTTSLFARPRYPYWRTKNNTLILPHIVVGAVRRSLESRVNLVLSTQVIEALCRYWTIRKDNNDGVMFNRRMYHALEVAERCLIRTEQTEEQDFTPEELISVVDKLLAVIKPAEKPIGPASPKRLNAKINAKATDATSINRKPKRPITKRELPSTRRRMRELNSTVASARVLRKRN